jgi:hypothetical protein
MGKTCKFNGFSKTFSSLPLRKGRLVLPQIHGFSKNDHAVFSSISLRTGIGVFPKFKGF